MRRRNRRDEGERLLVPGVEPSDVADMAARFAAVEAEQALERDTRLAHRLRRLVERRVPLRRVEAVTGLRASRLCFADGTAVMVRGAVAGDVGVLASWVRATSVLVASCSREVDGVHLVFSAPRGRRRLSVLVAGLDQPV